MTTCLTGVLAATLLALAATSAVASRTTDNRTHCTNYDGLRQPFFGETHLHTGMSFDASIRFVHPTPRDAYNFAKGGSVVGVGPNGFPSRTYTQDRPLDFAAVTDHSEHFGEMGVCKSPDLPGRFSFECQLLNGFYWQPGILPGSGQRDLSTAAFNLLVLPNLAPSSFNTHLPLCVDGQADCAASELTVWQEMQDAAKEANDPCSFTSFIAYEMTSNPAGQNWHRNVIFRNEHVIPRPITAVDIARKPNPDPNTKPPRWLVPGGPDIEKLWDGLREQCLDAGTGCDVLTIPHNSNLAGGQGPIPPMFFDPPSAAFAQERQFFEPLVEIYQDKGSSECRWDPRFKAGVQTTDEKCGFELLDSPSILAASGVTADAGGSSDGPLPPSAFNERMYVRNVLKDGLLLEQSLGVNPFKLGIIAATDSHNGNPSYNVEDERFGGHLGLEDAIPVRASTTIQNGSGGVAVVWAEENTRDSIFDALKRKETYGTSGTRPIVRFFGGWNFNQNDCKTNFVEKGYQDGVPMGGDLPAAARNSRHRKRPTFLAAAWMDDYIGTPLQQIQIVKGWVENGKTKERVFTVAGNRKSDATVDQSCNRVGDGFGSLCAAWSDPTFDPSQPAFYYVRVLENPVCRYSTLICQKDYKVNPLSPNCAKQLSRLPAPKQADAAMCCSNPQTAPTVQPVIQERAWTSPIWYEP